MMKRSMKRRLRVGLTAATIAAITMSLGVSGLAKADTIDDLTALAETQFEPLEELVDEDGGLGVFRDGVDNVVMIPAEKAAEVDAFQAELDSQLDGVLDQLQVSQFTTEALAALGEELGTREGNGITEEYGFLEAYSPETDTYNIQTDAPESILAPLLDAHPGQLSITWGTNEAEGRYDGSAPFYGASGIRGVDATCTSGIAFRDARGRQLMSTAGHCFLMDANVYMRDNWAYMGSITARSTTRDTEMIYNEKTTTSDYAGFIWTGGSAESKSYIPVGQAINPRLGWTGIYTSGQTTLNRSRGSIKQLNVNFCPKGAVSCISNRTGFIYGGGTATAAGDSGAPVYKLSADNKAVVVGLHSGSSYDAWGNRSSVGVMIGPVTGTFGVAVVVPA